MDVFSIISLFGGLALFLYGMHAMSAGLEKIAGGKLQSTLQKMTSHTSTSLIFGTLITMAIQSSSALTVMLVGLVNSGIMELGQTVSVILGGNIGTTITAWILSLVGIQGDSIFIRLLKPENFSHIMALIGVMMLMASKSAKRKDTGEVFLGFAILMYGMTLMSTSVAPLAEISEFTGILTAFNNPFFGVFVGLVFTGIIQSSSASVGILQALSLTGCVTYGMAIPLILGINVGTCVTALLSSIGTTRNAKRVAIVHLTGKVIGVVFCMIVFYGLNAIVGFSFMDNPLSAGEVAICHTVFNIITTMLLLPMRKTLVNISKLIIKDRSSEDVEVFLDDRLLLSPGLAVHESFNMAVKMSDVARRCVLSAMGLMLNYDNDVAAKVKEQETELDKYEDKLGTFLVKLSTSALSESDSANVSKLLHNIGDFERIGDHALNIRQSAKEMRDKGLSFSVHASEEVSLLFDALKEILTLAMDSFVNDDLEKAAKVEPLEQVIDVLIGQIKRKHIERLQQGRCTIELGFILNDLLNNCERISDHCSNIAVCVTEIDRGEFDTHEYLNAIKTGNDERFKADFAMYAKKYELKYSK